MRAIGLQLKVIGYDVWIDEDQIVPGQRILKAVEDAVEKCDYLIVFLSKSALRSTWVDEEWRLKFEQQIGDRRVRVIPVALASDIHLPPLLNGRLHVSGTALELLNGAAKRIDRGILELERLARVDEESAPAPLVSDSAIANIAGEISRALHSPKPKGFSLLAQDLLCARTVAATAYDAGEPGQCAEIYTQILTSASDSGRLWTAQPRLAASSRRAKLAVDRHVERCLRTNASSSGDVLVIEQESWSGRMAINALIAYVQAVAILEDYLSSLPSRIEASDERIHAAQWFFFGPLRPAIEGSNQFEAVGTETLEELCSATLEIAEGELAEIVAESQAGAIDLWIASTLRICRSAPRIDLDVDEFIESSPSARCIEDVFFLTMMHFDADGFAHLGQLSKVECDALLKKGPVPLFDAALTNRGYPRDADYWAAGEVDVPYVGMHSL